MRRERMATYAYKMQIDCGKCMLTGEFLATEENFASLLGKQAYFGEIEGHAVDTVITFNEGDFFKFDQPIGVDISGSQLSGLNPFEYLVEEDNNDRL